MPNSSPIRSNLYMHMSEFWSGDLGLTLVTISITFLVFVITPLREAGLPERIFFDLVVVALMISGALVVEQSLVSKLFLVGAVLVSAFVLGAGRVHPTPFLHQFGSILTTATLYSHRASRYVSSRPHELEPHPRRRVRVSSSRNGLGFRISVR
jgi:hypothetical protein